MQPDVPRTEAAQLAALAPYLHLATAEVVDRMMQRQPYLLRLAVERMREGYELHGDDLFTKAMSELSTDIYEELADAIVYAAEYLRREANA